MHRVCIYELILELYHATGFIFIISQKKNITQKYSKFEENVMKKTSFKIKGGHLENTKLVWPTTFLIQVMFKDPLCKMWYMFPQVKYFPTIRYTI